MLLYPSTYKNYELEEVGGKAFNLYRLKKLGMPVPNWVVIPQDAVQTHLPPGLHPQSDREAIKSHIDQVKIGSELLKDIKKHFPSASEKLFSVRSSAVQEDGAKHSFAGQFETFLYVSFEDIPRFVKEIWKSNFSDRVVTYLKQAGLDHQMGIAVVIQEMIDPEVSGIGFGINPNTGEESSKILTSVYGVGEGIVSGELNADTYTISGKKYEVELADKTHAAKKDASGKTALLPVEDDLRKKQSLSDQHIQQLIDILDRLEKELGHPQDIEFAIQDDQLYLLQTRPITAINQQKEGTNRIIWDNSNIIESYPGVTTPLTFSYILSAYKHVYIQLARIMGASEQTINDNEDTFANMLGLIRGRVYYNLLSWYKVLALFPGYRLNARFMENMMGVKERFDLPQENKSSKISAFFRTVLMVYKIFINAFTIKKQTRKFLDLVDRELERVKALPLDKMTAYQLKTSWLELDNRLTPNWKAPLINDSFAMLYFGKLQRFIEKNKISDNPNIQNDLLCGSKDIISVEPIHRSIEIATLISEDQDATKLFKNKDTATIWQRLKDDDFDWLKAKIESYIDKFGDRCVGELKLETVSFKQDPLQFIATLKSFVNQGVTKKSTASTIDQELRKNAETTVKKALKNKPLKYRKFKKLLKKTRYFVSNRENLRYERTRVFGITREYFAFIGQEFEKHNQINNYRDIFYLTKEEIFDFIEGTAVSTDLKSLVNCRKNEYAAYEQEDPPAERFTTFGAVNIGNDFYDSSVENKVDGDLSGLGCCPGIVRGKVRLIKHPGEVESLNGDILVTSSTDPGWVTLFPTASAIIVERGSLLSHSAIVSREMGIPCIVGVSGLLKTLKTGDMIEMNGNTGIIKILSDDETA